MSEKITSESEEIFLQGIPTSPGIAIGLAYIFTPKRPKISVNRIEEHIVNDQLTLWQQTRNKLDEEWSQLKGRQTDEKSKNILATHIEIIRDPELSERIKKLIEDKRYAISQAITTAFDEFIDLFTKTGSPVITNRRVDLSDIRDRLIELVDNDNKWNHEKSGEIVVAENISPREIIQLSHQGIKGIVMEQGGSSSHAAIIARSIGIPAVVGAKGATQYIQNDTSICLDGKRGVVIVNPKSATLNRFKKMVRGQTMNLDEKKNICKKLSKTQDGHSFTLRANIEFPEELTHFDQCKAEGIGLLRTESIYLNRDQFGSRQNQQVFYDSILDNTGNEPVTIRLFDVGGDKFQNRNISESNPFLGWRGIRMLLDERELLREQLTAILAAAGKHPGRVKLLLPMVTMLSEIDEVKKEIKSCQRQLIEEGYSVDRDIPLGIMVEIPNVAIQAAHFAKKVDFFSIGTNDLIQYLLAVDRGNVRLSHLYNQNHPAMWQIINKTVNAAHEHKIKVEVCGELASYPVSAACLLGYGVDGLSMTPTSIPHVKQLLTARSFNEMKNLAQRVKLCITPKDVETLFKNWKNKTDG